MPDLALIARFYASTFRTGAVMLAPFVAVFGAALFLEILVWPK